MSTDTETETDAPPSNLEDLIKGQLAELSPLKRAPEVRRRIVAVQDQLSAIGAQIATAQAAISAHAAAQSRAAAMALDAGEPIPPAPPEPKATAAELAELRRQSKALEPVLFVLQRIHRDGAEEEDRAFREHASDMADDMKTRAIQRHRRFVTAALDALAPFELSGGRRMEVVLNLVDEVQVGSSPEERLFVAWLREQEATHPNPARKLRLEKTTRNLTNTKFTADFTKSIINEYMAKRAGGAS